MVRALFPQVVIGSKVDEVRQAGEVRGFGARLLLFLMLCAIGGTACALSWWKGGPLKTATNGAGKRGGIGADQTLLSRIRSEAPVCGSP